MNTPSVLANSYRDFDLFSLDVPKEKSENKAPINVKQRLGFVCEDLLEQYLNAHPNYKIKAKNLQVIENNITLGELDFIIEDTENQSVVHVELAYKFYLATNASPKITDWVGPNNKDKLYLKLQRFKEQQIPLLQHPQTKLLLSKIGWDAEVTITSKVCLLGQLFVPFSTTICWEKEINAKALAGFWLHYSQLHLLGEFEFTVVQKPFWILNQPKVNAVWHQKSAIETVLKAEITEKRAQMLWIKQSSGFISKTFIVFHL